ncbi:MAG: sulfur carrier protein ThiS [Candidatus Omnitrophota bacterium]|jgi:sulfur carrier protein
MKIRINGKEENLDRPKNLADLIRAKGLVPEHVVVEYNLKIILAGEWAGVALKENDSIEIISFVGGG